MTDFRYSQSDLDQNKEFYIECEVGDKIYFDLRSNPSTGYQWLIPQVKYNDYQVYSFKSGLWQRDQTDDNRVGVGGNIEFTFTAQEAGSDKFQLVYGQPWTLNDIPKGKNGYYDISNGEGDDYKFTINVSRSDDL